MKKQITKKKPKRRCIGCMTSYPQEDLIRFTWDGEKIVADTSMRNEGRGFYLCRNRECLESAIRKKAFNRVCKKNIDAELIRKVVENAEQNN